MAGHGGSDGDGAFQERQDGEDDRGGVPVPHSTWIVDYAGDGRCCVRRIAEDGSSDGFVDPGTLSYAAAEAHEYAAAAHATVFALPGDTIVFTPAFALIYALGMPAVLEALLSGCPQRMPRRKHCPHPMWPTENGIGIVKGSVHADQHSVFSSTVAVNGFNLGLRGSSCAGTKRRWEWVGPTAEGRDGGSEASEN